MEQARAVIIGGGVGGTSIAYHLAELGWTDVVLVDRAELTSGSTFHSAGLVGQLRSSVTLTRMMMYGTALYRRLTAETGVDVSWHEVGSLRLASTKARYEELQRQAGWAATFGLPLELVTAREAQERFPLMTLDGVLGAVWLPTDGWLDPSGLAQALAAGARARGAQIRQHTRVVGINVERGRVTRRRGGARRRALEIATDVVVNAGGMFAPEIGRMAGVTIPIIPMAHQYLFTHAIEGVRPGLPTMRDPDNLCYFREEVGGLCMGGYERDPAPWSLDGVPADFNHRLLDPDWPRFESIMEGAIRRVPAIADAGVTRMINGPEAFTPDNEFILGESEVRGFFVAAGFCAHGIAGTGGIGQQMARWIVDGEPELDLWKMDIRRFGGQYRSQEPHAGPDVRELRDLLRHPLPERGAARPPARSASRRPTRRSPPSARSSARSRCGSARTGSPRTRMAPASPRAGPSRRSGREAGRGSTGARRSGRRRWRHGRRPACSTSRASPRSRSTARARSPISSTCAPTTSTGRWARSSTRRCSTGGAGSSATSRSRALPRIGSSS